MGISPFQLLIVLIIVLVIFGGNRLKNLGSDLGAAIKGFKKEMADNEKPEKLEKPQDEKIIEGKAEKTKEEV